VIHEKRIEIRWRDVDAYGHVNNAVYATYFEECRDEWLEEVLGREGGPGRKGGGGREGSAGVDDALGAFVLARVAIDFRSELRQDDDTVLVRVRLARIGNSSVSTREEIVKEGGELSAESEAVLVARDRETGRSRPLSEAERAAFERARATV
jgi:acyl-CoA thioester hydrolase